MKGMSPKWREDNFDDISDEEEKIFTFLDQALGNLNRYQRFEA